MATDSRKVTTERQVIEVADAYSGVTVQNLGPDILYYGGATVSSLVNDGSVAMGGSATFTQGYTVVSAGRSRLALTTLPPSVESTGGSGLPSTVTTETSAYTAAAGELVQADTSAGGFTVTLPSSPATGALVAVKKLSSDTNTLTIAPAGGGTIDGEANATTITQWAGAVFEHVGSDDWVIAASMSTTGPAGADGTDGVDGINAALSIIQNEGVAVTQRDTLDFVGGGVNVTDTGSKTQVEIAAADASAFQTLHVISGRYTGNGAGSGTGTLQANRLYYVPYKPGTGFTCTEMGIECSTAAATAVVRLGIYSDSDGLPGSLLVEATSGGTLSLASTGYKASGAISQAFLGGTLYWLAIVSQVANGPIRACSSTSQDLWASFISNATVLNWGFVNYAYYQNSVTGALPATPTIAGTISDVAPKIFLKAA